MGLYASSLCALHCCIMPFLIAVTPLIGFKFLASNEFEWLMISLAGLLGGIGTFTGFWMHQNRSAIILFCVGIFTLVSNQIVHATTNLDACCSLHSTNQEVAAWTMFPPVIGGILIASSHIVNQHLCKQCETCNNESDANSENQCGEIKP